MSRIRPLHLDFGTPSRLSRLWGSVILGIGLLACIWAAFDYQAATDDLTALQSHKESLEVRRGRQSSGLLPTTPESEFAQIADAARQLRRPWDLLLQELENAADDSVALLSLEPDPLRQQLRITGEARQLGDALAFVQRLDDAKSLQRPTLTGHQSRQTNGEPVVTFSIQAGWKENG